MEITHASSTISWGHEVTQGFQIVPPDLIPVLDEHGVPVLAGNGEPVMTPPPNWEPAHEAVDLDTIVIIDRSSQEVVNVYKFSFSKIDIANFITTYVELLDVDGRKQVRDALSKAGGVIEPTLDTRKLSIVKP